MELEKNEIEIASRSLEKKLRSLGIDVEDGELTFELQFNASTLEVKTTITGPQRVLRRMESLWQLEDTDQDLAFDSDEVDSVSIEGPILPLD